MTADNYNQSAAAETTRQSSRPEFVFRRLAGAPGAGPSKPDAGPSSLLASEPPRRVRLLFWKEVLLAHVRSGQPNLTNRQMTVLMVLYASDDTYTVGGLAAKLTLSSPVVSRSLNMLEALGYLKRSRDPADARNSLVHRTASGAAFLTNFGAAIASASGR